MRLKVAPQGASDRACLGAFDVLLNASCNATYIIARDVAFTATLSRISCLDYTVNRAMPQTRPNRGDSCIMHSLFQADLSYLARTYAHYNIIKCVKAIIGLCLRHVLFVLHLIITYLII